MSAQSIVIWGAGRIGRGFVADLFDAAGYRIVLVDESKGLIAQLHQARHYTVVHARSAEEREDRVISGFSALTTAQTHQVATAVVATDLIAVAVFPKDFPAVVRKLVPHLETRQEHRPRAPLDIILCANIPHAGTRFGALLQEAMPSEMYEYAAARIGIVESLVIRMVADPPAEVRQQDPLLVWTNGYGAFPVDRHAFKGEIPGVPALRLVDDVRAEETRKLYTYNTYHAALAYHGARRGYARIVDCIADPAVGAEAEGALHESRAALEAEYGFEEDAMAGWIEGVLTQTDNPTLRDTVARYGADPRRKLGRADRLTGPAVLAHEHGIHTPHLIRALAAALLYRNPDDAGALYVQERITSLGLPGAIRALCQLTAHEDDLVTAIVRSYDRLRAEDHWADLAQQARTLAFEHEKIYHGCGQCTLAAIFETLDQFDEEAAATVLEAATPLAGGFGLAGDSTCAALIGAALAFGMLYPRRRTHFDGDRENKYRTFSMAQRMRQRYLETYGSISCHQIQRRIVGRAFDLRDPAERAAFDAAGAHDDRCTRVVADAARWAVEIIGQEQLKDAEGK